MEDKYLDMVHYIRVLKPPMLTKAGKQEYRVSALVTVTTDLGDMLFSQHLPLYVSLHPSRPRHSTKVVGKTLTWTPKSRVLSISIDFSPGQVDLPARLLVSNSPNNAEDILSLSTLPGIISAWSAPFDDMNLKQAEPLVERRFNVPNAGILRIWEETGDSIARHIWDSGPPYLAYLDKMRRMQPSLLCDTLSRSTPLMVVELGSGCGIVGIGLAQMVPNCDITLTDLPDAQEILQRNVTVSKPAHSSRISACILDWESELPAEMVQRKHDLIIISDCTYNTDTIPALVNTLSRLTSISPQAIVFLATKVRHDSEAEFFAFMIDAGFSCKELSTIELPNLSPQYEGEVSTTDIYEFRRL